KLDRLAVHLPGSLEGRPAIALEGEGPVGGEACGEHSEREGRGRNRGRRRLGGGGRGEDPQEDQLYERDRHRHGPQAAGGSLNQDPHLSTSLLAVWAVQTLDLLHRQSFEQEHVLQYDVLADHASAVFNEIEPAEPGPQPAASIRVLHPPHMVEAWGFLGNLVAKVNDAYATRSQPTVEFTARLQIADGRLAESHDGRRVDPAFDHEPGGTPGSRVPRRGCGQ